MDVDVRPVAGEPELREAWQLLCRAFNWPRSDEDRFVATAGPLERTRGVFVGGQLAAFSRVRPFGQHWGGRRVPMGGYSPVVTAPEHRGRGLATLVTTAHFEALRDRNEPLAGLFPASTPLYRKAGFGLAGVWTERELPADRLRALPTRADVVMRLADRGDRPAIEACYARVAPATSGWLDRPAVWWERILDERWAERQIYVVEGTDGLDGYVVYEHLPAERWGFTIRVHEVVARRPEVALALWRLVGTSSSLVRTVLAKGPPEHPLLLILPEQDLRPVQELRWMLRLIDASAAVAARGFPPGLRAVVDLSVADAACPWNDGLHRLEVEDGSGTLVPGGTGAFRVDASALATLYAGYASAGALAAAGLLRGAEPADIAALEAVFAGPTPWMPDFF
jgi:predicted acetyltransferase